MRRLRLAVALGLAINVGVLIGRGSAEDAPPPPPPPTPLEALFTPLREKIITLPPFLGETDVKLNIRSYYFNRTNPNGTVNEAKNMDTGATHTPAEFKADKVKKPRVQRKPRALVTGMRVRPPVS